MKLLISVIVGFLVGLVPALVLWLGSCFAYWGWQSVGAWSIEARVIYLVSSLIVGALVGAGAGAETYDRFPEHITFSYFRKKPIIKKVTSQIPNYSAGSYLND